MSTYQERLNEEFERFIEFGTLLDKKTRKYLVQYLQVRLGGEDQQLPPEINDTYYRYFRESLDRIFSEDSLLDLCRNQPLLSQQITADTLNWIRKTHQKMQARNPYHEEAKSLESVSVMPLSRWIQRWHVHVAYLEGIYSREEFPADFYKHKFETLIAKKELQEFDRDNKDSLEKLITDLLSLWDALLQAKLLEYQLKHLQESQEDFKDLLEAKAEEFKKLHDLISPFAEYSGHYWDMSRELWEDTNFDLLTQYDDLLQNEASIKELADLLGQMREAEIMTEEETFDRVLVRKEWIEDINQRSEIVGVHESDDLDSILSSEISLLGDENTETVFLKKYADKGLLTFKYHDQQLVKSEHLYTEVNQRVRQKEKGPFIICVDTSDSMSGRPEHIAKVLCFAILKMAARESRRAFLINFSVGVRTIDLYDIANSIADIADFLRMSFHGGTDISLALYEVLRQLYGENYKDADVLIISDFIMYRIDEDIIQKVKHHQQNNNTQFHSLILSENPNAEVIAHFDSNWLYDPEEKGIIRELEGKLRQLAER